MQCIQEVTKLAASGHPELNRYGDGIGLTELRNRLKLKLKEENGIEGMEVMITAVSVFSYMKIYAHAHICSHIQV